MSEHHTHFQLARRKRRAMNGHDKGSDDQIDGGIRESLLELATAAEAEVALRDITGDATRDPEEIAQLYSVHIPDPDKLARRQTADFEASRATPKDYMAAMLNGAHEDTPDTPRPNGSTFIKTARLKRNGRRILDAQQIAARAQQIEAESRLGHTKAVRKVAGRNNGDNSKGFQTRHAKVRRRLQRLHRVDVQHTL